MPARQLSGLNHVFLRLFRADGRPVQRRWILSTLFVKLAKHRLTVSMIFAFNSHRMGTATYDVVIVGAGATAAGMGHIVVMDDSAAQFALTRYSQRLWQELRPELPPDVEYDQCGTIWVAAEEEERPEVQRNHDASAPLGFPATVLDSQVLGRLDPNLRDGLGGGLLVAED